MTRITRGAPLGGADITTIGVEHALLSYLYLDKGDTDGYASLLDANARFVFPGRPIAHGPEAAAALAVAYCGAGGVHRPGNIISSDTDVVVTGVLSLSKEGPGREREQEFADFFAINGHGLLHSWRRFHRHSE